MPEKLAQRITSGSFSACKIISGLCSENEELKSGALFVDDELNIQSICTYETKVYDLPITTILAESRRTGSTGIIVFAVVRDQDFTLDEGFAHKLLASCEAVQTTLLDLLLYSPTGWTSLRQKNLL